MFDDLKLRMRTSEEGCIPYLYLDSVGLVTCAVGHMVPSAEAMDAIPMIHADGSTATADEARAEWDAVKALTPNLLPGYYEARTTLRLTDATIGAIQDADVEEIYRELLHYFPDLASYPEPAQEAIVDYGFEGPAKMQSNAPKLCAAILARDWPTAAAQSHRVGIQDSRNVAIAGMFMQAAGTSDQAT